MDLNSEFSTPLQTTSVHDIEDALWTVTEVAKYLRLKPATVRSMAGKDIPAYKMGRVWRFDPHKIKSWVNEKEILERNP